eukprot:jgi/Psemu1/58729/gm1.58729_g
MVRTRAHENSDIEETKMEVDQDPSGPDGDEDEDSEKYPDSEEEFDAVNFLLKLAQQELWLQAG